MALFVKKISPQATSSEISSPVLLLHGFCENHTIWHNLLSVFHHRVIYLVDLPGFGKSSMDLPQPLSIDWIAETIYSQVIKLEGIKPSVIGHSLGGYVALALAEKYEQNLSGICLFNSTAFADSAEKQETRNKVIDFVDSGGVKEYTTQFVPGLFHSIYRRQNPESVQQVVDIASKTNQDVLTAYVGAMRDRPERISVLETFSGPKLVIAGDKDGAVPLEQSLRLKEIVGPGSFVLLNDTAHMGMFERPEECKRALATWL